MSARAEPDVRTARGYLSVMGLVVSRFHHDDPLAFLPRLRAETEARLGKPVALRIEPGGYSLRALGANIVMLERDHELEVISREVSWLVGGGRARVTELRRALSELGGVPLGWSSIRYRFPDGVPSAERVAGALGTQVFHRFEPSGVMTSGLRTPVEIRLDGPSYDLEAPIMIFGKLYDSALAAARALSRPVELG